MKKSKPKPSLLPHLPSLLFFLSPSRTKMDEDAVVDWIPLWKHRMSKIMDILTENHVESVLDFGCGEGKLLQCLRHNPKITSLVGIDVDRPSLTKAVPALQPLLTDLLLPRLKKLTISLLEGSVDYIDPRFTGYDAAILIEVIEHLDPSVLYKCPTVIFGALRPKVVVISTPNSEFNVHFGPERTGILRHDDHRFEWTRPEFTTWCESVAKEHGYSVSYDGVGDPKPEFPGVGHCTQIAIFKREPWPEQSGDGNDNGNGKDQNKDEVEKPLPFPIEPEVYCSLWTRNPLVVQEPDLGEYQPFHELEYPSFVGDIEDEIQRSLIYCFKTMSRNVHGEYDPSIPVTVEDLLQNSKIKRFCETRERLIQSLEDSMVFSVTDEDLVKADIDLALHDDGEKEDDEEEEEDVGPVESDRSVHIEAAPTTTETELW